MDKVSLEKIIAMVTRQVIEELQKNQIEIVFHGSDTEQNHQEDTPGINKAAVLRNKVERIDMGSFRSPVLTENHILRLHELTGEIVVPKGTVLTPKARQLICQKNISLTIE